jgi:hypothetical protein
MKYNVKLFFINKFLKLNHLFFFSTQRVMGDLGVEGYILFVSFSKESGVILIKWRSTPGDHFEDTF